MPRISTCRRFGVAVLALASVYAISRTFLLFANDDTSVKPFRPVRSKFHVDAEKNANIPTTPGNVPTFKNIESGHASKEHSSKECPIEPSCQPPRLFVWMTSESRFTPPLVCISGLKIFEGLELVNGFNVAVLDDDGGSIKVAKYIQVAHGDSELIEFLAQVSTPQRVVIVSYGEVANRLSAELRQLLNVFGASSLENFVAGKSLLFVGQIGLPGGKAQEKITERSILNGVTYSACLNGETQEQQLNETQEAAPALWIDDSLLPELSSLKGRRMRVALGKEMPNCGIPHRCLRDEIPMSFYTGTDKNDSPSLCVNDHFIMDRGVNDAGRGLNLVVVDSETHQVMRCGHFDTYERDSSELVMFLEQLAPGEIVAVVSFDEASTKLSDFAKQIFYELGSSLIQNMKFRSSWYFVGQKGIDGYTAFEDLTMPSGNDWAKPINKKICIPSNLNGLRSREQSEARSLKQNSARRHFCGRYDGYEDFCADERLEEELIPRGLTDLSRASRPIFSVPILIVGGLNMNNIRLCLESVYEQEGVDPRNVVVAFDSAYPEVIDLSALFRVRSLPLNTSSSYNDLLMKALSQIVSSFPSSPCFIVIEEDVLLARDFLYFLDQLLPTFLEDPSVSTVLTFNKNGFTSSSSIASAVYRVENVTLSGAFLLKRSAYEKYIVRKEDVCCSENMTYGWLIPGYSYMPDVSRVTMNTPSVLDIVGDSRRKLFAEPRISTKYGNETVANVERLRAKLYDADLKQLIDNSKRTILNEVADCQPNSLLGSPAMLMNLTKGQSFSIIYSGERGSAEVLARCFHLFFDQSGSIFGSYKGVTRFSVGGHPAFLIKSTSIFADDFHISSATSNS